MHRPEDKDIINFKKNIWQWIPDLKKKCLKEKKNNKLRTFIVCDIYFSKKKNTEIKLKKCTES